MREYQFVMDLVGSQNLPKIFKIRQTSPRPRIEPEDIPGTIRGYLSEESFAAKVRPSMRVAIMAGSRGTADAALVTKTIVGYVKPGGAEPFVVPAMGSHGGTTAEKRKDVLESYGITESYLGYPIPSSMEIEKISVNEEGMDASIGKYAAGADNIIVSCRIKPRTALRGSHKGGIMKMTTIGPGEQYGAKVCHETGSKNMAKYVPMFGKVIIKNVPILFAVAVVENVSDETCKMAAAQAENIVEKGPPLLKEAFTYMPRMLVSSCDVLAVDQTDKNFSSDGMDPNTMGTLCIPYAFDGTNVQRVYALDLSPETHGNGIDLGHSSTATKRVFNQLDLASMYPNVITYIVLGGARIPIVTESDRETIQVCVRTCNEIDKRNPRIVRIPNSLHPEYIVLSEAYHDEVRNHPGITIENKPEYLLFGEDGNPW